MDNTNAHRANQCNTGSACERCEGIFEHASWCATREPRVSYAYRLVMDPSTITPGDSLILHSLGVAWASGEVG